MRFHPTIKINFIRMNSKVFFIMFFGSLAKELPGVINRNESADSKIVCLFLLKGEKAYQIAGEIFVDMWQKVTGQSPDYEFIIGDKPELSWNNFYSHRADAVNPVVHELIRSGTIEGLNTGLLREIITVCYQWQMTRIILALPVAAVFNIYSVYDFFRKQAGGIFLGW